jgi:hypothetical protein
MNQLEENLLPALRSLSVDLDHDLTDVRSGHHQLESVRSLFEREDLANHRLEMDIALLQETKKRLVILPATHCNTSGIRVKSDWAAVSVEIR